MNFGLALASASVDGVLKLWNVQRGVCMNTYTIHSDKIWALDICGEKVITGGADSTLCILKDCTS